MPDMNDLADKLFGTKRAETTKVSSNSETITLYGTAVSDSEDGTVSVVMSDSVYLVEDDLGSEDATTTIEMPTHITVREGDEVAITLVGNSTAKSPVVSGVVGGGDRQQVEIDAAKKAADDATEAIGGIEEEIGGVQQEITDFKRNTYTKEQVNKKVDEGPDSLKSWITANYTNSQDLGTTYATKTLVSQTKEEIKLSASQTYATKGESQPNLSPFYAHDLTDIYDATDNPDGYFANNPAMSAELGVVGTQLPDGWMHVEMDNSARTGYAYIYLYQRPLAGLRPSTLYTLMMEFRNMDTDADVGAGFRITTQADDATHISQTVNTNGYDDIYLTPGGTFYKALATKPDMSAATLFCRQYLALAAGKRASFDVRFSLYETASPEILLDTNAPTLEKVDGPFDRYLTDAAQTQVTAAYGAIADPPEELGSDARYGISLDFDGNHTTWRTRSLGFYSGSTTGETRPTFMAAGKQYQASVWARKVSGTAYLRIGAISSDRSYAYQPTSTSALALTDEWQLYSVSLRPVSPSYSRIAFGVCFLASMAGAVELCGFSLQKMDATFKPYVTDQAALSKEYATQSQLKVGLDGITAEVSETYATKTASAPNLNPFFAHDFLDIYNATTNPGGWWRGSVQRDFATQLKDGWARVVIDNTSGTALFARAFRFGASPDLKDGGKYTCLVEMRNILSKPTSATIYTQQGTDVQFWGDYRYDGWTVYWEQVEGDAHVEYKQMKRVEAVSRQTTGVVCFSMNVQVPAGQKADFEIRLSLFENESNSKGKTIPYAGPYKPFVTDQQALSREYTTKSQLKVESDNITSTVNAKLAQTTRNLLMGCVGKEFSNVTWLSDNDVSDGLWRPYHAETTLTATEDGIRADHAGTANGGIAIPLVADGCISAGETLTLSFEYRTNRAPFGALYVLNASTPNVSQGAPADLVADGEWHAFEHTWTAKGNAQVPRALLIGYYRQAGAWIEIKDGSCLLTRGESFTKTSTFTQTVNGMDGRITATEDGLAVQETLIRQYAGGVLVCKVGESVGALVNASGSFDVVSVSWSGNNPTVGGTVASLSDDTVSLLSDYARMYVDSESEDFVIASNNSVTLRSNGGSCDLGSYSYEEHGGQTYSEGVGMNMHDEMIEALLWSEYAGTECEFYATSGHGLFINKIAAAPVELFSGNTTGTVTLSELAAYFDRLVIYYESGGSGSGSVEVSSPNGKTFSMQGMYFASSANIVQQRFKVMSIAGASITRVSSGYINTSASGAVSVNTTENNIAVVRVLGYRKYPR